MTPEERADRIIWKKPIPRLSAADRSLLRARIIKEVEAALAEAKAEVQRGWAEKVRLVHGERG